ncbi:MAG: clostripain-related cysteine peptidase [Coriobacteriia bacterium]|nr:clostripain-related cysteine peptidase [Coriobacteriia bacterium]
MRNLFVDKTGLGSALARTLLAAVLTASLLGSTACRDDNQTNAGNWGGGGGGGQGSNINLGDAPYSPYTAHDGTWAVYWYICGSDIELREDMRYNSSGQVLEMMEVVLPSGVTCVIQAGGATAWHLEGVDPNQTNYLVYQGDTLRMDKQGPQSNMGDPQTLADFLAYCNQNYPAEHQALILYDHGGGSLMGTCNDDNYAGDSLSLPELSAVIGSRPAASGSYELIGLCACLMSTIDCVSVFNGYCNYLVGSEEVELGCTWDYTKIFSAIANDPGLGGAKLGQVIGEGYYAQCEAAGYTMYTTSSVIDMSKADELLAAFNAVGDELLQGAAAGGSEYFAAWGRAAYASENYGAMDSPTSKYEMVDLGDLMVHASDLLPNSSARMLRAIDSAMAFHLVNPLRSEGHGVSCYFPYVSGPNSFNLFSALNTSPGFFYFYEYAYTGSLSRDGQDYLASLSSPGTPTKPPETPEKPTTPPETPTTPSETPETPTTPPETPELPKPSELGLDGIGISPHGNGTFWLELGDRASNVAAVYLLVYSYDQDTGDFLQLGTRNDIYSDWDEGYFYDEFAVSWGSIDGALCYMEAVSWADDAVLYRVPVFHNGSEKYLMVLYSFENGRSWDGSYQILGVITASASTTNAPSPVFDLLRPGDVIEPVLPRHTPSGSVVITPGDPMTSQITVSSATRFYDIDLGYGLYTLTFQIIDYSGTAHYSQQSWVVVDEFGYHTENFNLAQ